MRLSELLGKPVVTADGTRIGEVHDVRLVQDGRPLPSGMAALRAHGLLVGPGGIAFRLGYDRTGVRGPWLLKQLLGRRRGPLFVPWGRIEAFGDDTIRVQGSPDDYEPARPLDELRSAGGRR